MNSYRLLSVQRIKLDKVKFIFLLTKLSKTQNSLALKPHQTCLKRRFSTSLQNHAPTRKFAEVNSLGTHLKVGYDEEGPSTGEVILALHGAPGASQDFNAVFEPLATAGYRVIAINFPGYGVTTVDKKFLIGSSECTKLSLDFLDALGIDKVVAWMGHSWGTHVAYHLAAESDRGRALLSLSSLGYMPQKAARPLVLLNGFHHLCHTPVIGIPFIKALTWAFNKQGFRIQDSEPLLTALGNIYRSGWERMEGYAGRIKEKNMPSLFVSTKSDSIVEPEVAFKMARACGFTEDLLVMFDENKQYVSGPKGVGRRRHLLFARGGHYAHRAHTDIVVPYILGVLEGDRVH